MKRDKQITVHYRGSYGGRTFELEYPAWLLTPRIFYLISNSSTIEFNVIPAEQTGKSVVEISVKDTMESIEIPAGRIDAATLADLGMMSAVEFIEALFGGEERIYRR
ncbi:hypothetical protein CEF21_15060 [Bacillus sp. FJAT-42376]|uniref:hypothetical protein n=1 Tax=Bacillus sp. FJAT-42376 TaxID=2014076 RepID=UPI000F4F0C04|nr:hypothetical protein [Bacillus sp. FJAT-42376]AZB43515.1 hypothetical protein CEF21_15060 [Bacillus sp. FJAT-42376]